MILESLSELVHSQTVELKKLWKNKRNILLISTLFFMYFLSSLPISYVYVVSKGNLLFQALNLAMIVFSALMIWKGLMFITKSGNSAIYLFIYPFIYQHINLSILPSIHTVILSSRLSIHIYICPFTPYSRFSLK